MRRISNSPTDPDAEGRGELDSEEVDVVPISIGHQYSNSPYQPASRRFHSQLIHITPRNIQPVISNIPSSIPPCSPNPSTARPALV
ncbi:hypothetical protein O181_044760 [Austropuccinia psidii MF-1]|uniref:Uncharacterized protein n=1 Tax=Austropuccinia psidii MF-1 TaxID=1389203 RepID=A0A9Q3HKH4_9BASI|nr:hypothetical protein [Austropuccinia psidii MF-1]